MEKDEVEKAGYKVVESANKLRDDRKQKLEQIKSILPDLVNSDGLLDAAALKDFIGVENFASANQGYGLNFAGKGLAKIKADEPTKKELKVERSQSKNFDKTGNVIIRGDNIDALKILRQNYEGKIKMIYIDPPYNTDSANFIYNDSFKEGEADLIEHYGMDEDSVDFFENMFGTKTHSGWLFAMYPRLKLARDLLTDDGVIFISIDDNEQANLKIMCDEIFGAENFIGELIWEKKTGASDAKHIATITESILVYAKNSEVTRFSKNLDSYNIERFRLKDKHISDRGKYYIDNLDRGGLQYTDSLNFPIECPDGTLTYPNGRTEFIKEGWIWKWSKKKVLWAIEHDFLDFRKSSTKDSGWAVCYKNYLKVDNTGQPILKSSPYKNLIQGILNTHGTKEVNEMLGNKVFQSPKPVKLLKHFLLIASEENDIILDFFAGSGTIGDAVMKLNSEDISKRKFILVQWDEKIEKNTASFDFCEQNNIEPVISSICIERVNRAGEKIKTEMGLIENGLDTGYKVFSLTDRPELEQDEHQKIMINHNRTTEDTLYNMIAASGESLLTDPIEEIEPGLLYKVNNAHYVLGECKTELRDAGRVFVDGYANIGLQKWFNMLGLDNENVLILY